MSVAIIESYFLFFTNYRAPKRKFWQYERGVLAQNEKSDNMKTVYTSQQKADTFFKL
jgi:hypothetical protein